MPGMSVYTACVYKLWHEHNTMYAWQLHIATKLSVCLQTEMALFYAANHERPYSNAAVELILSHGMDINARDPWVNTDEVNAYCLW